MLRRPVPYYARYPLFLIVWKPLRKYLNVAVIPNVPFTRLRVCMYRWIGYRIGRNVFIGMCCYMDDVEPANTEIEDNVTVSYGTYFACHGKGQGHTTIRIKKNSYIGMRCNILSGKEGIEIGPNAIIGAGSLINRTIPQDAVAAGCPARIIRMQSGSSIQGCDAPSGNTNYNANEGDS